MKNTYTIENEIPVPPHQNSKYPWDTLEVGQSFLVDPAGKSMFSSASLAGKKRGKKFIGRKVGSGVRVWRVA